jgi:hypothetical protein
MLYLHAVLQTAGSRTLILPAGRPEQQPAERVSKSGSLSLADGNTGRVQPKIGAITAVFAVFDFYITAAMMDYSALLLYSGTWRTLAKGVFKIPASKISEER